MRLERLDRHCCLTDLLLSLHILAKSNFPCCAMQKPSHQTTRGKKRMVNLMISKQLANDLFVAESILTGNTHNVR
jgi:hypothetical protein